MAGEVLPDPEPPPLEPPARGAPPDPRSAIDIPAFVALLKELRGWAGNPGYKKTLQAWADKKLGPGQLSGSTVWRVLESRQDLVLMREPERFVRDLVDVLGAEPAPWLETLDRLLNRQSDQELPAEDAAPDAPPRRRWWTRRAAIVAGLVMLAAGGVVAGTVTGGDDPAPPTIDYARAARVESGATGLRLAIDRNSAQPGGIGVVRNPADATTAVWEAVAPYRDNPDYRQLRPVGRLLMCLEVKGGSFDDRATVQQWGCNGERNQYWKPTPSAEGMVTMVNLNSGQCLATAGATPQAGMQLVQRPCEDRQRSQEWKMIATADPAPPRTTSAPVVAAAAVGPDAAEYPGGGKDRPCDGGLEVIPAESGVWSGSPFLVREEDPQRGEISIGANTVGAVQLFRANRRTDDAEETFYWAEGYVKFSPQQFTMALQWTTLRGPGGWHTCEVPFTAEHGKPSTVALPRDQDRDRKPDVWFRVCLTHKPERDGPPIVNCTGRY
ncbi:RICIN domain-containing protein [Amycolatopsis sp. NPDC052450]|uniref:RICIN domain-containing protein n=1 Tax=Amycolatopsis sp. NPDC052450 TaxID=3363937 RepID=UPI0037C53063